MRAREKRIKVTKEGGGGRGEGRRLSCAQARKGKAIGFFREKESVSFLLFFFPKSFREAKHSIEKGSLIFNKWCRPLAIKFDTSNDSC